MAGQSAFLASVREIKWTPGGFACLLMCFVLSASLSGTARATVLLFDQTRDSATSSIVGPTAAGTQVQQDYGDRVTGSPMAVPGGAFTYGNNGEGFTPNVVVDYFSGNNIGLWTVQYGDLNNVVFATAGSNLLNIRLSADLGFEVLLHGFDLAGWLQQDYVINGVSVTSGGTTLFSQNNVLVQGDGTGPGHTSFDFAGPLRGSELLIGIDFGNLLSGQQDNIGIDNIRFAQDPPPASNTTTIPMPTAFALFLPGLWLLSFARRSPPPTTSLSQK